MDRRDFLRGILAAAVAPAFVKTAGLLMPVKPLVVVPEIDTIVGLTRKWAMEAWIEIPRRIYFADFMRQNGNALLVQRVPAREGFPLPKIR